MATYSSPNYVDSNTFTVSGDHTSDLGGFDEGRAVRCDCGADGVKYGVVESATYSDPNTTVNLDSASDAITSNLTEVITSPVKPGIKGNIPHTHQRLTALTKTGSYSLTTDDLGKSLRMNSSTTATFTLPSVDASNDGDRAVFTNIGSGVLFIETSDSDKVNRGEFCAWIGQYESITLEYDHSVTAWRPVQSSLGIGIGGKKGYVAGGSTASGEYVKTADKITFATETVAACTSADLTVGRGLLAAASDADTKGYFAGGYSTDHTALTDKVVFSNDTTSSCTTANLSQARSSPTGLSERSTKGYFAGGNDADAYLATADKLTFSNDTTAACTTADLSQARGQLVGLSEGSTKGYFAGGYTGDLVDTTDKITFSTDSTAACTTADLTVPTRQAAGASKINARGYIFGGVTGGTWILGEVKKIIYSIDTSYFVPSSRVPRQGPAGLSEGDTAGYALGGYKGGYQSSVYRVTYATDTSELLSATLSQARVWPAGLSDVGL